MSQTLSSAAVIKMEGGTDLDLQVLELPTAAAAGEASSSSGGGGGPPPPGAGAPRGGGEKSQGDLSGGNVSRPTDSESTSRTEETKVPNKVSASSTV